MNTSVFAAQLEEKYKKIEECNKILKDGTQIYLLKKLKKEFESCRDKYLEKNNEMILIKDSFTSLSLEIKKLHKVFEAKQDELKRLVAENNSEQSLRGMLTKEIDELKVKINEFEENNMEMIEKEEAMKEEVQALHDELIILKANFNNFKEKSNKKIIEANEIIKRTQFEIMNLKETMAKESEQK